MNRIPIVPIAGQIWSNRNNPRSPARIDRIIPETEVQAGWLEFSLWGKAGWMEDYSDISGDFFFLYIHGPFETIEEALDWGKKYRAAPGC